MINAKRLSIALTALLVLQAISSVVLIAYSNSWLTKKSESIVELKLDTALLDAKQNVNLQAAIDLNKYESTRILLEKIVPKSKDQAKTIGELQKIAAEIGVTIDTMTFPASELGNSTNKAVAGTTPSAAAASTTAITQAKPIASIPGVLGIEVSLSQIYSKATGSSSGVTYKQLLAFLEAIEKNRRTMQIKTLQVVPIKSPTGKITGYTLNLTMNIFVKP